MLHIGTHLTKFTENIEVNGNKSPSFYTNDRRPQFYEFKGANTTRTEQDFPVVLLGVKIRSMKWILKGELSCRGTPA